MRQSQQVVARGGFCRPACRSCDLSQGAYGRIKHTSVLLTGPESANGSSVSASDLAAVL
jgi:hypothetical protein